MVALKIADAGKVVARNCKTTAGMQFWIFYLEAEHSSHFLLFFVVC